MEAPKLPSVFKQNQARGFEFKPRYYNERKERLEELKRKHEGGEPEPGRRRNIEFRSGINSEWREMRQKSSSGSNVRLFAIIIILFLITYLIIYY